MGRRNLTKDILHVEIELQVGDIIGRVLEPRGKNLHAVEYREPNPASNKGIKSGTEEVSENCSRFSTTLCLLPPKFRNLVWVKRGGYVVIRLYTEKDGKRTVDCKIGGTIEHVLFPYHIKRLKLENKWPPEFEIQETGSEAELCDANSICLTNPNRRQAISDSSSDED